MSRSVPSGTVHFSDEALAKIVDALPLCAPPERAALLPQIFRAWAQEDLREHLSREGRKAARKQEDQLHSIAKQARGLIDAFEELPPTAQFLAALRPELYQTQQTLLDVTAVSIEVARQRLDHGVAWLTDLAEALHEPQPKMLPDTQTRNHLVTLDLAAIFQLVSEKRPTRQINTGTGKDYGPFWTFASAAWPVIFGSSSGLSAANKRWATKVSRQRKLARNNVCNASGRLGRDLTCAERCTVERRFGEYSSFVANLQFRHPDLWQKLRELR